MPNNSTQDSFYPDTAIIFDNDPSSANLTRLGLEALKIYGDIHSTKPHFNETPFNDPNFYYNATLIVVSCNDIDANHQTSIGKVINTAHMIVTANSIWKLTNSPIIFTSFIPQLSLKICGNAATVVELPTDGSYDNLVQRFREGVLRLNSLKLQALLSC